MQKQPIRTGVQLTALMLLLRTAGTKELLFGGAFCEMLEALDTLYEHEKQIIILERIPVSRAKPENGLVPHGLIAPEVAPPPAALDKRRPNQRGRELVPKYCLETPERHDAEPEYGGVVKVKAEDFFLRERKNQTCLEHCGRRTAGAKGWAKLNLEKEKKGGGYICFLLYLHLEVPAVEGWGLDRRRTSWWNTKRYNRERNKMLPEDTPPPEAKP